MTLQDRAESLTGFVRERAGQHFLGTVTYTEDSYDLLAVDPAVEHAYDDESVAELVERLRGHQAVSGGPSYPDIPAGHLRTAVYVLERAIVLHFMLGKVDGVAVALNPDAGRNLFRFITEASQHLSSED